MNAPAPMRHTRRVALPVKLRLGPARQKSVPTSNYDELRSSQRRIARNAAPARAITGAYLALRPDCEAGIIKYDTAWRHVNVVPDS